jgi:hypothetical protein
VGAVSTMQRVSSGGYHCPDSHPSECAVVHLPLRLLYLGVGQAVCTQAGTIGVRPRRVEWERGGRLPLGGNTTAEATRDSSPPIRTTHQLRGCGIFLMRGAFPQSTEWISVVQGALYHVALKRDSEAPGLHGVLCFVASSSTSHRPSSIQ